MTIHSESVGQWPFPVMEANPDAWVEISEEHAFYCLEVLPPIYFKGGFAVSEPQRHTADDVPIYTCVVQVGPRSFARNLTTSEAESQAPTLRAAVQS